MRITNEKGRSMIEMLGVLAIIGVLSVGGIAGYAKAMAKFKTNKTIDLVTHSIANTRILFGGQGNYKDLGTTWEADVQRMAFNAKLFPDENMKATAASEEGGSATYEFKNAYGGDIFLYYGKRLGSDSDKAFVIALTGIPQAACIDLATQDWAASSGSGFVSMAVTAGKSQAAPDTVAQAAKPLITDYYIGSCTSAGGTTSYKCGQDNEAMSTIHATQGCSGTNFNNIYLKFY